MNRTDMKKFEEQIQRSAQRLRDEENTRLDVAPSPLGRRRLSWGWVATPAAAAVGLVIGMFAPSLLFSLQPSEGFEAHPVGQTVRVVDTVVRNLVVRDTVYVSRSSVLPPDHIASATEMEAPQTDGMLPADTMGKCILEDGVDYSLLASF